MPLIKPRTRGKKYLRLVTRLEHETNETLYAYAAFLTCRLTARAQGRGRQSGQYGRLGRHQ